MADNGFRMKDYWIWDPSIIRGPDGLWHMFASRWLKTLPFHPGWMLASEVVRATAERPEGPYQFQQVVFPARGAQYWDGRATHNATLRQHGGRYYLFYMGSTNPLESPIADEPLPLSDPRVIVARSMKRIGVAWADRIEGPWHRRDAPILTTKPNTFHSFLVGNPAPCIHEDGRVDMLFKARAYEGDIHGHMSIGLARADDPLGSYSVIGDAPVFSPDNFGEIEDPFLWHDEKGYHMIAKDMHGGIAGCKYGGVCAHSTDAMVWTPGEPTLAYGLDVPYVGSGIRTLGNVERPFLLRDDSGCITHLCAAVSDGYGGWSGATETWNVVIPVS